MMLSFRLLAILGSVVAVLGMGALQAEGLKVATLDRKTEINFNKEIYPFFKRNCLACHNNSKAKAKLILETADDIRKGSSDGEVMIPGKADESLLFTTSAHIEEDVMPPKNNKSKAKNLTPQELALLKLWINQGGKGSGAVIAEAPKKWLKVKTSQPIYALAISPDGRYAASGRGQHIDIYDIKLQQWQARLVDPALKTEAHHDLVRSLAFDTDGTLASGGYRMIKLWQASSMAAEKYKSKQTDAKALATSKDGAWSLYLNDKRTQLKRLIHASKKTAVLDFPAPISAVAILHDQKEVVLGFDSGTIRVMRLAALELVPAKPAKPGDTKAAVAKKAAPPEVLFYELKGHGKGKLQFVSDAKHALVSASAAGKVIVWDLKLKKPKLTFNHGGGLVYVALQSKANRLLTASASGRVLLWDLSKPAKYVLSIGSDPNVKIEIAQLSIDKSVAGVDIRRVTGLVKKMEDATKKELESSNNILKEIPEKEKALKLAQKKLSDLSAVKPPAKEKEAAKKKREDGVKLAKDEVDKLDSKIASLKVGKARAVVMHDKAVKSLAVTKVDKAKLDAHSKGLDEKLKAAKLLLSKTAAKYLIAGTDFSEDGKYLAVAYQNGSVHLYTANSGMFIETLFTKKKIKRAFFSRGEVVTLGEDGTAWSWPAQRKWSLARSIGNGKDGKILIDRVTALGFGPESSLVSASGIPSRKGQLKLWDKKTLKLKAQNLGSHKDLITSIDFSPDKKQIVTGSADGTAKIYDLAGLKMLRSLEGHSLAVLDVSWSGDGRLIATSGADGGVVLWHSDTGEKYKTIKKGNGEEVTIVKFMAKNSEGLLVSEGGRLLKANKKNLPGEFKYAYSASLSPDGALILAGGQSGELRLWDAKKYRLLKTFEPVP